MASALLSTRLCLELLNKLNGKGANRPLQKWCKGWESMSLVHALYLHNPLFSQLEQAGPAGAFRGHSCVLSVLSCLKQSIAKGEQGQRKRRLK